MAVALANVPVRVTGYTSYTITMSGGTPALLYTLYVTNPSGQKTYVNAVADGSGNASFRVVPQATPGTYSVALRDATQTALATALDTGSFVGGTS